MFKYSLENIDKLYEDADLEIVPHRKSYSKYADVLEKYITKSNSKVLHILYSNVYELVDSYLGNPIKPNIRKLSYSLYSDNALRDATNIANIFAELNKYVVMNTIIYGVEYAINIDGMPFLKIRNIPAYKNISIIAMIDPFKSYISPEIETMFIYKKIYSPEYASDWVELYELESKLHDICMSRIQFIKGIPKSGGGLLHKLDDYKLDIINYIIDKYSDNVIFVGELAYKLYINQDINTIKNTDENKLQCITNINPAEFLNILKRVHPNVVINMRKQDIHIPIDNRQDKYTYYITDDKNTYILLELFNNIKYELVPYDLTQIKFKNETLWIKTGCMQVMLYFAYTDIWVIHLINKLGSLNDNSRIYKISNIFELIKSFRDILLDPKYITRFNKFTQYLGVYDDEKIYNKKILSNMNISNYIPVQYKNKHNKYRIIS